MMTHEMRKSPPETYADLKERNYTLYITDDKNTVSSLMYQVLNRDGMQVYLKIVRKKN